MSDATENLELYLKHRPRKLKDIKGQSEALAQIKGMLRSSSIPHVTLFAGPPGCGKTSLARILASRLGCKDALEPVVSTTSTLDFYEINAASTRGIDMIKEIQQNMGMAPLHGDARVWLLDETAELTSTAQKALLKTLEDTPRHVYFMLATTDPDKLIKAIQTRCTRINVKSLSLDLISELVKEVATKEDIVLSDEIVNQIAEASEGSARKALVFLHQIRNVENEDERKNIIQPSKIMADAFNIVKQLLWEKPQWSKLAELIKTVDTSEPERLRHLVLAVANKELLKAGANSSRAYAVICAFESNWYDCKESGLTRACFEIIRK